MISLITSIRMKIIAHARLDTADTVEKKKLKEKSKTKRQKRIN